MALPHLSPGDRKKSGIYRPQFQFGLRPSLAGDSVFIEELPFRKSWPAIFVVAALLIGFSMPLFLMDFGFGEVDDLFDLTTSLFSIFWAIGWLAGIFVMALFLMAMLFAREVLIVEPDRIRLRIELFNPGIELHYSLLYLSNLHYVENSSHKGSGWRGKHLAFDYLHMPISFGSDISQYRARGLLLRIQQTLRHQVPALLSEEIEKKIKNQEPLEPPDDTATSALQGSVSPADVKTGGKTSLYLLVAANLIPVGGVILAGWDIGEIMLLFWLESAIIALFNILKMLKIAGPVAIFYSIFFIGHFGAFMAVHLMFIFALFIENDGGSASIPEVLAIFKSTWIAIVALLVSHGFSYRENFINNREYLKLTIRKQMHKPYSRIMIMHVTLIFGGFLVLALNFRLLALMLLIGLKIIVDLNAHIREHR